MADDTPTEHSRVEHGTGSGGASERGSTGAGAGSGSGPPDPDARDDPDGDTYIHDPEGVRPHQAPPSESGFDWRGWLLVGVILVCFLVVPAAILFLPQAQGLIASLGLTLRDAYLVLPLIPAFLLGAVAVWAAVKSRT
ncbi:MAG: hypothetical protein V5A30_04485 [Haloarculaceae archaeon]